MKIACIGDSLTYGFGLSRRDAWPSILGEFGLEGVNLGINGDTTYGMLARLSQNLISDRFTHCVIMGGTNDIWFGLDEQQILANLYTMAKHTHHYQLSAAFITPPPFFVSKGILDKKDPWYLWPPQGGFASCQERIKSLCHQLLTLGKVSGIPVFDLHHLFFQDQKRELHHNQCQNHNQDYDPGQDQGRDEEGGALNGGISKEFYLPDGLHFSPLGHRAAASFVAKMIGTVDWEHLLPKKRPW